MGEVIGVLDNISFEGHTNVNPENPKGNSYALVPIQYPMGHRDRTRAGSVSQSCCSQRFQAHANIRFNDERQSLVSYKI